MSNLILGFKATCLKLVVSFRPFFWVYHVRSWHQRMTAKKTRQVLHLLEHSKIFLCTCILWGLWIRNKPLTEEVLSLKFISGHFSILGAQTTTMVAEALLAQPKGFIRTCALIFIVCFFVCFMQNNVELKFKLKVLWRTQTFSPHEIHIKNHPFKQISWLEQTNKLVGKLNKLRYWKKYQKFR